MLTLQTCERLHIYTFKQAISTDRAIVRACQKANVAKWTPHQLCHNYATAIRRDYGIEAARILLGHASIVTTDIYAEADRQAAQKVTQAIG